MGFFWLFFHVYLFKLLLFTDVDLFVLTFVLCCPGTDLAVAIASKKAHKAGEVFVVRLVIKSLEVILHFLF